jgi:hypothetical protein
MCPCSHGERWWSPNWVTNSWPTRSSASFTISCSRRTCFLQTSRQLVLQDRHLMCPCSHNLQLTKKLFSFFLLAENHTMHRDVKCNTFNKPSVPSEWCKMRLLKSRTLTPNTLPCDSPWYYKWSCADRVILRMFNFKCGFLNIYAVLQVNWLTLYYHFYWIFFA